MMICLIEIAPPFGAGSGDPRTTSRGSRVGPQISQMTAGVKTICANLRHLRTDLFCDAGENRVQQSF
jgi:hypothetical protein